MTREDFIGRFASASDAIEYETNALSIGNEFLPPIARQVRDGSEPTSAYWSWLCDQVDRANGEG